MTGEKGFVLLTTLIFLQIYALLSMSALEEVTWHEKLVGEQRARRNLMNQVDAVFKYVEREVDFSSAACLLPQGSFNRELEQPLAWWKTHACLAKAGEGQAYYIVEYLGSDPCAYIQNSDQEPAYYRLSLGIWDREDSGHWFQITLIKEAETAGHCEQQRHSVDLGRQSWRER